MFRLRKKDLCRNLCNKYKLYKNTPTATRMIPTSIKLKMSWGVSSKSSNMTSMESQFVFWDVFVFFFWKLNLNKVLLQPEHILIFSSLLQRCFVFIRSNSFDLQLVKVRWSGHILKLFHFSVSQQDDITWCVVLLFCVFVLFFFCIARVCLSIGSQLTKQYHHGKFFC